jgi:hypothetical protein
MSELLFRMKNSEGRRGHPPLGKAAQPQLSLVARLVLPMLPMPTLPLAWERVEMRMVVGGAIAPDLYRHPS